MMDLKLPHARKEPLPGDVFEPRRFTRGTDEEGLLKNILPGPPGDGDNVGLTRQARLPGAVVPGPQGLIFSQDMQPTAAPQIVEQRCPDSSVGHLPPLVIAPLTRPRMMILF